MKNKLSKEERIKHILFIYDIKISDLCYIEYPVETSFNPVTKEMMDRIRSTIQNILDE